MHGMVDAVNSAEANSGFHACVSAPFGFVGVRAGGEWLEEIVYLPPASAPVAPRNALAERVCRQIAYYLDDPGFAWDVPLRPAGTAFQRRVWACIAAIPRGHTCSYGHIAKELGSAARAVGQACGQNPFPLVIPCHRVVGARGLGGFAHHADGFHVSVKRWLLAHEAPSSVLA
jgi:methylated-DNA-[protein]-cysteine S-methyltransferase